MTININFQKISASTISGGGIFLGQNIALGWDSFTKSNTGVANGNHSPINNSFVIVDDRDCVDAPMIDADHPVANAKADPPGGGPNGDPALGSQKTIRRDSEGGNNNQLVIKRDGKQVYPSNDGSTSDEDEAKEEEEDDPPGDPPVEMSGTYQDPGKVKKVSSQHDLHAAEKRKNPRKILFERKKGES